jgi:chemotaxis regulatin CheY-phosphate phosphatase CheZ
LVRSAVDAADGKAVDAIKREITPRLDESARRTDDAVRKLDRVLDERIATVTGAVTEIRQRLDGGYGVDSNRTAADLQQVLTEVKRASDETKRLSIEVQRLHSTTPGDGVTRKGLFRRLWN